MCFLTSNSLNFAPSQQIQGLGSLIPKVEVKAWKPKHEGSEASLGFNNKVKAFNHNTCF